MKGNKNISRDDAHFAFCIAKVRNYYSFSLSKNIRERMTIIKEKGRYAEKTSRRKVKLRILKKSLWNRNRNR